MQILNAASSNKPLNPTEKHNITSSPLDPKPLDDIKLIVIRLIIDELAWLWRGAAVV